MLDEEPTSLATVIPKRNREGWDTNSKKKRSKLETIDAALNIMNGSSENALQEIHAINKKRGTRERKSEYGLDINTNTTDRSGRAALGDITNKQQTSSQKGIALRDITDVDQENGVAHASSAGNKSKGTKRKLQEVANPEVEHLNNPPPQKVTKTSHKKTANPNREVPAIEISSSGDENEEITNEMRLKPTLYHLAQIDLESVRNKNTYMRGTCVQAIIELLHAEKRREDLTCVSTDFYTLLMENKFTEAKKLLHPEEGWHNWEKPANKIATAHSRILIIPCHAVNHWFLTLRIKLQGGKHQVIIIDSLGQKSGNSYMPELRERLKQMNLITKKEKCTVLKTRGQTEVECGVRMAAYMVLFRSMDLQQLRDGQILERLKGYVAREKSSAGNLAAQRRTNIHRLLEEEQAKVKE